MSLTPLVPGPPDFNGDGRRDLLELSRKIDGTVIARQWLSAGDSFSEGIDVDLGASPASTQFLVGDLDGDGKSDLLEVRRQRDGSVVAKTWRASAGTFLADATSTTLGKYPASSRYYLSDSTGDGKADLIVQWLPGGGKTRFTIWQGDGQAFAQRTDQDTWSANVAASQVMPVDINGDGRDDLVYLDRERYADGNSSGYLSTLRWWRVGADGNWDAAGQETAPQARYEPSSQEFTYLTGDADGDGRQVVLRIWADLGENLTAIRRITRRFLHTSQDQLSQDQLASHSSQ